MHTHRISQQFLHYYFHNLIGLGSLGLELLGAMDPLCFFQTMQWAPQCLPRVEIIPIASEFTFLKHKAKPIHLLWVSASCCDRLCGLVVRVLGYRSGGPIRFDSRHYQKKKRVVVLERGPLSFVSTTEELLDRKVAAPV
jgi:hypothetical protein